MTDDEWRVECRARIAAWRASDHVHNASGRDNKDGTNKGKVGAFKGWTETITAAMREEWNQHWRQVDAELKRGKRETMGMVEVEEEEIESEGL